MNSSILSSLNFLHDNYHFWPIWYFSICYLLDSWMSQKTGICRLLLVNYTVKSKMKRWLAMSPESLPCSDYMKRWGKKHIKLALLPCLWIHRKGRYTTKLFCGTCRTKVPPWADLKNHRKLSPVQDWPSRYSYLWQQTKGHLEVGKAELLGVRNWDFKLE